MCNEDLKLPIVELKEAGETLNISQHVPGLSEPAELSFTRGSVLQMNIKAKHLTIKRLIGTIILVEIL